jgi:hypothetical protein
VLDYLPHEDDTLREQGDVWLGFEPTELNGWLKSAGLKPLADFPLNPAWVSQGPDAQLSWHAWVASRNSQTVVQLPTP